MAALEITLDFIKKGYQITQDGAGAIQQWSHADFDQHNDHFSLFTKLNPAIQLYFQNVTQIRSIAILLKQLSNSQSQIEGSNLVLPAEKRLHKMMITDFRYRLLGFQVDFNGFIYAAEGQFTDNQRLSQFMNWQNDLEAFRIFCRQFMSDWTLLIKNRQCEVENLNQLGRLYNK